jgi:hypothetical protein
MTATGDVGGARLLVMKDKPFALLPPGDRPPLHVKPEKAERRDTGCYKNIMKEG